MSSTTTADVNNAESTLSKAAQAEFAKDYDLAFRLYIKATESFLHLSRTTSLSDKLRQQCKTSAAKALERAERIKRFVDASRTSPASNQLAEPPRLTPVAIDHFAPQEQFYVLKKGEVVNSSRYPLWVDKITSANLQYSDPHGQPKLSPEQVRVSTVWKRPSCLDSSEQQILDRPILPQEILQHIVTDCSVCASISVCLEHSRRFVSRLAESSMHNEPSSEESYHVRVMFNGAWRRIVIDDKLPFHPVSDTMMCMSILPSPTSDLSSRKSLWPSFLEKAYMKLMGGYDFPGSNSSADLHALTGWIPEHVEMRRSNFEREKTWERIIQGFSDGHCVVTLGTSDNPHLQWRDTRLLPSHSYAVINIYETQNARFFTILDSWVRSEEDYQQPSRVLEIPWFEVVNVFDSVYLSWNPSLWPNTSTFHGMWKRNESDEEGTRNLQISFTNTNPLSESEIWVLLTRHVGDTLKTTDFISLRVDLEDDIAPSRSALDNQHIVSAKATYTNGIHVLTKTRIPPSQERGILSILASYDGPAREVGFTLTVLAPENMKVSWVERVATPPYVTKIESSFTAKTAGGNCKYPSFMVNPQYHLIVHPPTGQKRAVNGSTKAHVTFTLKGNKDIPVNVAVVWSRGERVSELPEKDLAVTSGAYTYGLARASKELSPGEYSVVASAFEPHYMGAFSLKVECSSPFDFKPIPQEGAGMYTKMIKGTWEGKKAAGRPSLLRFHDNPTFELRIPSTTKLKIRLQLLQSTSTPIPLNLTLYSKPLTDPSREQLATTGAYDDAISGVVTPTITLGTGKYYLVVSTYAAGIEAGFRLILHSSVANLDVKLL